MKTALIGDGRTGGRIPELLPEGSVTIFNQNSPPTLEKLNGHDVIISFAPGNAFVKMIPLLLKSNIPVIIGSTGFLWPTEIETKIKCARTKWVIASNFSIGMNLIQGMIKILSGSIRLFNDCNFTIHEIHHTNKKDAPSGTALSWEKWLGQKAEITSERTGDVVGIHRMNLITKNEKITLEHEALDRKIFAEGAIWAARKILSDKTIEHGLHYFEDIVKKELL